MNRWQALTKIVTAFIDKGFPGYAFATVCLIGLPIAVGASAIVARLLH